jgi:hypothetical protein
MPGLEDEVIALAPATEAPKTIFIAASSDSACTKTPPACGILFDMYAVSSFCGVIGYPAYNLQPASAAPSPQASFPHINIFFDMVIYTPL